MSPDHHGHSSVCQIDLFGTARLQAGVERVFVPVAPRGTLRDLVAALAEQAPGLVGGVLDVEGQRLVDGYIFNRDGRDFLASLDAPVAPGERFLLLASVAGGSS